MVTQEMGKVLAEAEEECDGLFKDDYLDLIEAANAPQVRQSRPHYVSPLCQPTVPAHCATLPALEIGARIQPSVLHPRLHCLGCCRRSRMG